MRKHFLLLFLMALLPLAGWAEAPVEVTIQCANITFYYGATDIPENGTDATVDMIGIMQAPTGVTKADVAAALTFERVGSTSTAVNAEGYLYRLVKKTGYAGDLDVAVTGGNGTLYINKRPVTLTATDAEKDYGAQNPPFVATITSGNMVGEEKLTYTVTRTSTNETSGVYNDDLVVTVTENAVSANYDITTVKGKFTIKKLTGDDTKLTVALASTDPIVYSGSAQEPALTVTYDGNPMTIGTDYTVDYTDNINASEEAKATVTLLNYATSAPADINKELTFTITPRNLGTDGVAADGVSTRFVSTFTGWTYDGTEKSIGSGGTQVVVDGTAIAKTNYVRTYVGDFTNATEGVAADQKPYLLFTGKGNYSGSVKLNATIAQVPLTITAEDKNKAFGTADPDFTVTYSGFVNNETAATEGVFEGELDFDRAEGEDPGTYAITPKGLTAKNYAITFAPGTLTINTATILVTPKAGQTKTYGEEDPILEYTVSPASLSGKVTDVNLTRDLGNDVGTYAIGGTAKSNDSKYTVEVATNVNFEITPATLTFTADDQIMEQGGDLPTTWTYTVKGLTNGDDDAIIDAAPTFSTTADGTVLGQFDITNENPATIDAAKAANYTIVYKSGKLSVIGEGGEYTLSSDPDGNAADLIDQLGGKTVNVKIDFTPRNARNLGEERVWEAENWNTLVLPFDISVADLSKAFGYALVNVINPNKTKINATEGKSEFWGKLTMKEGNGGNGVLAANKPILVKTADAINGVIDFGLQTIVAPGTEADALSVDAGKGAEFVGTYKTKEVTKNDGAKIWFYVGNLASWAYIGSESENKWDILPFEAYIDFSASAAAPTILDFYVEDFDGSTTAIKNINGDNANIVVNGKLNAEGWYTLGGTKLQSAPSQKGVYIKDGKKVVIK